MIRKKAKQNLTIEQQLARGPVDLPFLTLVILLTVVGLVMLLSASYASAYYNLESSINTGGDPYYYVKRQLGFALAGAILGWGASKLNYQHYRWGAIVGLAASVLLLMLVFTPLGSSGGGARRWLKLGIRFQPSEMAKIGVIMFFAARLCKRNDQLRVKRKWSRRTTTGRVCAFLDQIGFLELVPYFAILILVLGLLAFQPHLSGMILILVSSVVVLFVSGIHLGWFALGGSIVTVALTLIITKTEYMTKRIEAWREPSKDLKGSGYQLWQSQIAIGSGGLLGKGLGNSSQKYMFLPEEHNDFIFAIICEELGFIGALVIILLFSLLIMRGYWLAIKARDRFGTLLIVGIITLLATQVLLNICVVTGTLPTTGISLPFFSYGGTALLMQLISMGIVLGVSRQIPAPKAE